MKNLKVRCIADRGFCDIRQRYKAFDLTIGDEYEVVNEIEFDGKIYYELESNDSGEQFHEYSSSLFIVIRPDGNVAPEIKSEQKSIETF